jgi:hypothetical protein
MSHPLLQQQQNTRANGKHQRMSTNQVTNDEVQCQPTQPGKTDPVQERTTKQPVTDSQQNKLGAPVGGSSGERQHLQQNRNQYGQRTPDIN